MKEQLQDRLAAMERAITIYVDAFNRCASLHDEWCNLQSVEIAAGATIEESWWAVFQSARGSELHALDKQAQFDKTRAGFQYDSAVMAAKALIALKEDAL